MTQNLGTDVFGSLLGASFRGVPFPVVSCSFGFQHDHAQHLWPDRDGGHVEATGRRPATYTFRIPFRNGTVAGPFEAWKGQTLYPDVWRQFTTACADRTTGPLVHPELNLVHVKVASFSAGWEAKGRDGVDVDVTFVESEDDEDALANLLASASPAAGAVATAQNVDTLLGQMSPPWEYPAYEPTLGDLAKSIQAALDAPGMLARQVGGQIDKLSSTVERIAEGVGRLNDTTLWPITHALERMRASVNDLRNLGRAQSRPIKTMRTTRPTTLAALARQIQPTQKIAELVALNRVLAESPIVPAGSRVSYYGQIESTPLMGA